MRIQIRDVTDVMRSNVQKIMERGDRLEDLQIASDRLNIAGNEFRDAARKAQRRAWMQNFRSRLILICITVIIIICIIGKIHEKKLNTTINARFLFFHQVTLRKQVRLNSLLILLN